MVIFWLSPWWGILFKLLIDLSSCSKNFMFNNFMQGIIAHLYNVHICGESTPLSPRGLVDINEENDIQTLILSYFVEEQGDHYICLWQNTNLDDSMIDFSLHKQSGYDFENIDQENVEQSVTTNI